MYQLPKRYVFLLAFATFSLFLFYQGSSYYSVRSLKFHPLYTSGAAELADHEHVAWNHRSQHYPLHNFHTLPTGSPKRLPNVQHKFAAESASEKAIRLARRDQVKEVFQKAWKSYTEKAWLYDELAPISGTGRNTFGGWAATLVDALDTLWIMDMKEDFVRAVSATPQIDFTTSTDETINIFETTIRYLGGFLGAYDLSGNELLLQRATDVGEMLLVAFDTPNHLPITRWDWRAAADGKRQEAPDWQLVSELGSLTLEFTRLSQLTGDERYYDAVHRIMQLFDQQQSATKIPGLWPVVVNPKEKNLTADTGFTFGGMSDSLYEYLPKQHALLGGREPVYQKLYEKSIAAAKQALFFRPITPGQDDILISGDARASDNGASYTSEPKGQHLGCFTGGMLGLAGQLFNLSEHIDLARKLTDGCIWAYNAMERGIMPEIAHFVACNDTAHCPWDEDKWLEGVRARFDKDEQRDVQEVIRAKNLPKGYTSIDDTRYILRPEAIESVFILYRITGDEKYREAAWDMFTAIANQTTTEFANAAVPDISLPKSQTLRLDDRMESFFFAETLKYFYLIFSEPSLVSLDEFVLNTEAHPLRRPK